MWPQLAMMAVSMIAGSQQSRAQNAAALQNRDSAVLSQTYENRALNDRQRQEEQMTMEKAVEAQVQALQAGGMIQASERNISGVSYERQQQDVQDAYGQVVAQLTGNTAGQRRQLELSKKGTSAQAQSRINSMPLTSYNPAMDIVQGGLAIAGDYSGKKFAMKQSTGKELSFKDYTFGDWS